MTVQPDPDGTAFPGARPREPGERSDPQPASERRRALLAESASSLQALAADLSTAAAPREVAEVIARRVAPMLGAASAVVYGMEASGGLRLLGQSGIADAFAARHELVAMDAALPIAEAARRGEPVWLGTPEEIAERFPRLAGGLHELAGGQAVCGVPFVTGAGTVGCLGLGFGEPRAFDEAERTVVLTFARLSAQALERVALFERERAANARLRLLVEAGARLSSTLSYEATLRNVIELTMPTLADFGFFDVVEPGGEARRIARAHEDPETQALLEATRWVRSERRDMFLCALSSGEPALHPNTDEAWRARAALGPEHLEVMRRLGLRSMISVPIGASGRILGALTLFFGRSGRTHTAGDLELAAEIARRSAAALEHARLFEEAQRARAELEEAARLKDQFLAIVSHELRTPLTAILGWTRILAQGASPELVSRAVGVIERNASAQVRIVDDLLDVSRIVAGKLRLDLVPMTLEPAVRAAVDALRPAAEAKGVRLEIAREGPPSLVLGDADRLQQVAWNLVSNAIKFTPRGGSVTARLVRSPGSCALTVSDTGEGISPAFLPHLFERFRQADGSTTRAHGGLGLGLSIVRHIVELHGGAVRGESPGKGRGSSFTVTLPVVSSAPIALPLDAAEGGAPVRLDGVRVLLVEDEPDLREILSAMLGGRGARVEAFGSVAEALGSLGGEPPDVLLAEVVMPGEDGYALLRQLRARGGAYARVPAVALTAYAGSEGARRMLRAGFQMHVAKPVDPEGLAAVVANLTGRLG